MTVNFAVNLSQFIIISGMHH